MWEQINSNRLRSAVLVIGMGLLLLALGYAIGFYFFDNGLVGMVIAGIVWGIMSLVSLFQGDNILLGVAGARKVRKEDNPRLYNVVEEISIAAGLNRVPDVYIIEDQALNAFAIGRDAKRAAVAITAGLLARLDRDELQGVIAHEIAHIKNRDVSLMAISAVMLGAVVMLSWYASRTLFFAGDRRSNRNGGGGVIMAIIGLVLIVLAPIFAQLLHLAISRKREYLADASAAVYTRYPEGLASALEKMMDAPTQVRAANQATASMYTVSPFTRRGASLKSLLSTHPPIKERINILRAMGGGPSYLNYEKAFGEVSGKGHIIPKSALGQW